MRNTGKYNRDCFLEKPAEYAECGVECGVAGGVGVGPEWERNANGLRKKWRVDGLLETIFDP